MNGFSYENQSTTTYLVYSLAEEDTVDSLSLGMLSNNKILGLAPAIYSQMDADRFIRYNVSSKITAKQFLSSSVNRKRLLGVFKGVVDGILSAEDYMIDVNSIILDLDYIFVDVTSCEAVLICLPVVEEIQKTNDIGSFVKEIMISSQFDATENSDYVAKIFNFLNSSPVFSIEEFKKLIIGLDNPAAAATAQKPVNEAKPVVQQQPVAQVETVRPPVQNSQSVAAPVNIPMKPQTAVPQKPVQNQVNVPVPKSGMTPPPVATSKQDAATDEKQISLFYLMQHYNKENAEAYKAQKAKKKDNKTSEPAQSKKQPKQPKQSAGNPGFAIPGQESIKPMAAAQAPVSAPPKAAPSTPAKPAAPVVQQPVMAPVSAAPQPSVVNQMPQAQVANFGETTVLGVGGGIGETTVLSAASNPAQKVTPYLIRKKNNEKIALVKEVFRIGKERSFVDYFISDNAAVSRSHANFIIRDGEYFVVDTNSTNHTYVNGVMIQSNVETAITHGDVVKLANEEFELRLF